ncbi:MAG: phytanoyl-CoA dioxygenase family protein [Myxococcales bacterium]|nr:phytanoyl-CoA dioxygenase family protein [Myxococcales bacterium]
MPDARTSIQRSHEPAPLTPEERRAWAEDGFFIRRSVFAPDEVETLRRAAERVGAHASEAAHVCDDTYRIDGNRYAEAAGSTVQFEHRFDSKTIRVVEPFHHLDACFDRLIDDLRIVEPMCGLVGCERVALFTDKINLKRPLEGSGFRWHQDSPYWNHFCDHVDRLPNVMVALDDASERNGCFRVIRASHTRGSLPGLEGQGELGPLFTDPAHFDLDAQVPLAMPAGSLAFFSPHTVHGSEPNTSNLPRRAVVLTYQPAGHRMFKVDEVRDARVSA